jgi:hypothetical protein
MPDQPRFVTRKIFKFGPRVHGTDNSTLVVTEVLTPSEELTVTEQSVYSCGHRVDVTKAFVDRFTGAVVCQDCVVECHHCHTKLWVEAAQESLTGDYFCPDCRGLWPVVRFFEKLFFKK